MSADPQTVSDRFPSPSVPTGPQQEPAGKPEFAPYDLPAGGWGRSQACGGLSRG
jgi:hypothetical protein